MESWEAKYRKVRAFRLAVQFLFLFILNLGLGPLPIPLPILGATAPWSTFPSAFDLLQAMIAVGITPLIPLASIILSNIFVGRILCGWVCPFGLAQDLTAIIGKAKRKIDVKTHRSLQLLKWPVLLSILLTIFIFGYLSSIGKINVYKIYFPRGFELAPYTMFSPDSTLFSYIPISILMGIVPASGAEILTAIFNPIILIRYLILIAILVAAAKIERFWCRYMCPIGLLNSIVAKFSIVGLHKIPTRCDNCNICNKVCPVQIDIARAKGGRLDMYNCIGCLNCYFTCEKNAIVFSFES